MARKIGETISILRVISSTQISLFNVDYVNHPTVLIYWQTKTERVLITVN